jgi:hypothetical protein
MMNPRALEEKTHDADLLREVIVADRSAIEGPSHRNGVFEKHASRTIGAETVLSPVDPLGSARLDEFGQFSMTQFGGSWRVNRETGCRILECVHERRVITVG